MDAFRKGFRAFKAGRFDEADAHLARVTEGALGWAEALHLRGIVALQGRRGEEAEELFRRAIAADGSNAVYHSSLGVCLQRGGRLDDAEQEMRRAVAVGPSNPAALGNMGLLLLERGKAEEAVTIFQRLVELVPGDAESRFKLGNALLAAGQASDAAVALRHAVRLKPGFADAHNNLGNALEALGDSTGATVAAETACALRPNDARFHCNLARRYRQGGRVDAAQQEFEQALRLDPGSIEGLRGLSSIVFDRGDVAHALKLNEQLVQAAPTKASAHGARALYLERGNRLEEAEAAARYALALDPAQSNAALALARVESRRGHLVGARALLEGLTATDPGKAVAHIELGKVLDQLDDAGGAFASFQRGKALQALRPSARSSDAKRYRAEVDRTHALVRRTDMSAWSVSSVNGQTPAFFVGFPRSGTTLMERLLTSHPDVVTTQELPVLRRVIRSLGRADQDIGVGYPEALTNLSSERVADLRRDYWSIVEESLPAIPANRRLVDKLPLQIVLLPLVRRVFHEAPVLVALRDPRDVVLSCFMQIFKPNDAMANFETLESAVELYELVMGLWLDMRERLGLSILEYRYEDLIDAPRETMARVLAHFGLPWNDAVMAAAPAELERAVRTPSYAAVAAPMSSRAIGRWRRYREQLEPMLPRLMRFVEAFGYPAD